MEIILIILLIFLPSLFCIYFFSIISLRLMDTYIFKPFGIDIYLYYLIMGKIFRKDFSIIIDCYAKVLFEFFHTNKSLSDSTDFILESSEPIEIKEKARGMLVVKIKELNSFRAFVRELENKKIYLLEGIFKKAENYKQIKGAKFQESINKSNNEDETKLIVHELKEYEFEMEVKPFDKYKKSVFKISELEIE